MYILFSSTHRNVIRVSGHKAHDLQQVQAVVGPQQHLALDGAHMGDDLCLYRIRLVQIVQTDALHYIFTH